VTCLEVRERLTEHALGLLAKVDASEVERHLEWCAGCRKEAAELEEGASRVALALPIADPPSSLETRVVDRLRTASGRIVPGGRRRIRVLLAATLAAAMLALGATGWAIAERGHVRSLEEQVLATRSQVHRLARALDSFKGQAGRVTRASLIPAPGTRGTGSAVIFTAPGVRDQVVVGMVLPSAARGPYVVQLVDDRSAIKVGRLEKRVEGDWFMWESINQDLSRVVTITVLDGASRTLLAGTFQPNAG
jgi:Putative zinc-finger